MKNSFSGTLSPRLQAVLNFIAGNSSQRKVLADIGTDHAYLPIAAVQQGLCADAVACDLHPGPLAIADKNIQEAGLSDKIKTRLGDGLSPLSPGEAHCIVIAGMGGMRILGILLEGMAQARAATQLILQPQHDTVLLRKNLHQAGFEIHDEAMVREIVPGREHFYVIIAAQHTGSVIPWSEQEYLLGKHLLAKGGKDFAAFVNREKAKIEAYISQIRDHKALEDANMRLDLLSAPNIINEVMKCQK